MSRDLYKIDGFKELQKKIKVLPDKLKKREMLKILRVVARPTVAAARSEAPMGTRSHKRYSRRTGAVLAEYFPGNLKKSIGNITGRRGSAKRNAVIYVGPRTKGRKNDGYYGAMVHGGTVNQDPNPYMDRAYSITKGRVTRDAEVKTAKALQRQIDRLSR